MTQASIRRWYLKVAAIVAVQLPCLGQLIEEVRDFLLREQETFDEIACSCRKDTVSKPGLKKHEQAMRVDGFRASFVDFTHCHWKFCGFHEFENRPFVFVIKLSFNHLQLYDARMPNVETGPTNYENEWNEWQHCLKGGLDIHACPDADKQGCKDSDERPSRGLFQVNFRSLRKLAATDRRNDKLKRG